MLEHVSVLRCFLLTNNCFLLTNVAIPRFAYHSSIGGHLDDFHFLDLMNKAAMNISLLFFFCGCLFSFLLDLHLGRELLDHMVTLCLNSWGTVRMSSKEAVPLNSPTSNSHVWGFQFLHILGNTIIWLFYHSHPSAVVSHCGFDLNIPDG